MGRYDKTRKTIEITPRMAKRIRESRYSQDRKGACLICRVRAYADCEHSWHDVAKVCMIVRTADEGTKIKVAF